MLGWVQALLPKEESFFRLFDAQFHAPFRGGITCQVAIGAVFFRVGGFFLT